MIRPAVRPLCAALLLCASGAAAQSRIAAPAGAAAGASGSAGASPLSPALSDAPVLPSRPLRVAVIGAGPAGFSAAEALLKQKDIPVEVDMFDRLPVPYGLVRTGVAPDHQRAKEAVFSYEKVAAEPGFRFFGNVEFGRDISMEDLRGLYDGAVLAVGAPRERRLGVPGEDLEGSHSALEFAGWYNAHPSPTGRYDLSTRDVVVVGAGNVAMDVVRLLAQDPGRLASTDISPAALEALRASQVRTIHMLGRRGPAQAAFSPGEVQELIVLESADLVVRPEDLGGAQPPNALARKNVELLAAQAAKGEGSRERKIRLLFYSAVVKILGESGRAAGVRVERTSLVPDGKGGLKAQGTGVFETIPAGLVFRAPGYLGARLPGVPFDEESSRIPQKDGRVLDAAGVPVPGLYVAGWAKRGAVGFIGTQRSDSQATVRALLEDAARAGRGPDDGKDAGVVVELLRSRGVDFLTFADWKVLDALEIAAGKAAGKVREKFPSMERMLEALGRSPSGPAR